jgi:hypothetical protein
MMRAMSGVPERAALLMVLVLAVGCEGRALVEPPPAEPPPAATGSLEVTTTGLPVGEGLSVTLAGPAGFARTLTSAGACPGVDARHVHCDCAAGDRQHRLVLADAVDADGHRAGKRDSYRAGRVCVLSLGFNTMNISYANSPGWATLESISSRPQVLLRGTSGAQNSKPLAVMLRPPGLQGALVYTTFHNFGQATSQQLAVLRYFIFLDVGS